MSRSLQTLTLGCSKNRVDTEHILAALEGLYDILPEEHQVKRLVFRQAAKRGVPRSFCYGSRLPSRLSAAVPTSESACAASLPVFSITLSVSSST